MLRINMLHIPILCLVLLCHAFIGLSEELNPVGLRLLEQQECGNYIPHLSRGDGYEVSLGSRPWMARIQTINGDYLCGGSLILDQFVLTAAHCATYEEVYSVRLGEHNTLTDPDCINLGNWRMCMPPSENFDIERIITHANYKKDTLEYDLALIKLAQKVDFKKHISPICLPVNSTRQQQLESLENALLTGWGQDVVYSRSKSSNVLRETKLEYSFAKNEECFKSVDVPLNISVLYQICAIQDKFLCSGTFGSPFISSVEYFGKKRFVQFGVISFGFRTCNKTPVFSTNVVSFMPWITDILAQQQEQF